MPRVFPPSNVRVGRRHFPCRRSEALGSDEIQVPVAHLSELRAERRGHPRLVGNAESPAGNTASGTFCFPLFATSYSRLISGAQLVLSDLDRRPVAGGRTGWCTCTRPQGPPNPNQSRKSLLARNLRLVAFKGGNGVGTCGAKRLLSLFNTAAACDHGLQQQE